MSGLLTIKLQTSAQTIPIHNLTNNIYKGSCREGVRGHGKFACVSLIYCVRLGYTDRLSLIRIRSSTEVPVNTWYDNIT